MPPRTAPAMSSRRPMGGPKKRTQTLQPLVPPRTRGLTPGQTPVVIFPTLELAGLGLEALDDRDGRGVNSAPRGQGERDEVAQHDGPEQAGRARLPFGLHLDEAAGRGLDQVRGELEALARPRMLVGVVEEDRRKALGAAAGIP